MNFRPDIDPVEQTRDATSSAPGKVMAGDPAVSASGVDLGIDAEPTGTPADAGPPASRNTRLRFGSSFRESAGLTHSWRIPSSRTRAASETSGFKLRNLARRPIFRQRDPAFSACLG